MFFNNGKRKEMENNQETTHSQELVETDDYRERVIKVFRTIWGRDFSKAERESGVPAAKWKNLCIRRQQPTNEMLQSLAEIHPEFILWMITGRAMTLLQISPDDKWQQKLARAAGIDVDKRKKDKPE